MTVSRPGSFWADLQRRRVPRAIVAYVVGAFAMLQAAELVLPRLGLPDWSVTLVLALALLGLPIVALLAWTFELTPDGVRRDAMDGAGASLPVSARLAVIGAVVVLALAGGAFAMLNRDPRPSFPRDRIALLPFANATGIDSLALVGQWAADWIAQELTGTGLGRVVPGQVTQAAAAEADVAASDRVARLARLTGAGTLVSGTLYREGDSLAFHTTIIDGNTGAVIRALTPVSAPAARPSEAFDVLRRRVAGVLGSLLDSDFAEFNRALGEPPSYEAYREYVRGHDLFGRSRFAESLEPFRRAAALDSGYLMPRAYEAFAHLNLGRRDSARGIASAVLAAGDVPPMIRHWLGYLFGIIDDDLETQLYHAQRMRQLAPGLRSDYDVGRVLFSMRRPRAAIDSLDALDPTTPQLREWIGYWWVLTRAHHMLGDHRSELERARAARRQQPSRLDPLAMEAHALAALDRPQEALARIAELLEGGDPRAAALAHTAAGEMRRHGHEAVAGDVYGRILALLDRLAASSVAEAEVLQQRFRSLWQLERYDSAQAVVDQLLRQDSSNSTARLGAALLAAAGDRNRAEAGIAWLIEEAAAASTPGHLVEAAQVALRLGDQQRAAELLREASRRQPDVLVRTLWLHRDPDLRAFWNSPLERELTSSRK